MLDIGVSGLGISALALVLALVLVLGLVAGQGMRRASECYENSIVLVL